VVVAQQLTGKGGDDLFMSAKQMRTLLHGDRAVVQVAGIDRRGRREGSVVSIIERANLFLVGSLSDDNGIFSVRPDNKRLTQDVFIPAADLAGAEEGLIVKVEITQQPTFKKKMMGKVVSVIGGESDPGMEIEIAIHNHGLPNEWPDGVLAESSKLGPEVREEDKQGRVDLRATPLVTIDGEDARDFDDAVYCEPSATGWRLLVAIADVAHYVQPGSALDTNAYDRATSVYFPGRVIPMLPEEISNGLCSLNPDVDRLCMVCEMQIDEDGEIAGQKFYEAVFRSHARLTYDQVAEAVVEKTPEARENLSAVLPHLEELYVLFHAFMKARTKRGSIEFDSTETKIDFTDDKRIESIKPFIRNDAHRIIEECMIAANVSAAKVILKNELPALYRDHDRPDDAKLDDVRDFLSNFALTLGKRGEKATSKDYGKLINKIKTRPAFHLIQTILLRSLSQAVYSPDNIGHFGLSLENYAHFTSPIRRYPDLLVHRGIRHVIRENKRFPYSEAAMTTLGEHCSANERRADEATRDVEAWLKCQYVEQHLGEPFNGVVTAVTSFGLFVELQGLFVDGLVHISGLGQDYFVHDIEHQAIIGERTGRVFRLGDTLKVRVASVNLEQRKIDLSLDDASARQPRRKVERNDLTELEMQLAQLPPIELGGRSKPKSATKAEGDKPKGYKSAKDNKESDGKAKKKRRSPVSKGKRIRQKKSATAAAASGKPASAAAKKPKKPKKPKKNQR